MITFTEEMTHNRKKIKNNISVINEEVKNWQESISISTQALYSQGYVKEEFSQACINREKIFPTGIPSAVPIAIPHAEGDYVIQESVCVLHLKEPVGFSRMDNPDDSVSVRLVINLAIQNNNQVLLLKKIWGLLCEMILSIIAFTFQKKWFPYFIAF